MLQDLRRQRDDLHVLLFAQLTGDRSEDAGRPGLTLFVDDHDGVLVEPDVAPVLAPRVLHGDDDDVAEPGVPPARSAKHADHERRLRARVVRHLDHRFLLDHWLILLARAIDDLDHTPPLVLRQRTGFHDAHGVTGLRRVLLVVRLQALGPGDHLAVDRVRDATFDRDDHRLLHLVAHDDSRARLARIAIRRLRAVRTGVLYCHDYLPPARTAPALVCFSRNTVLSRAMSRRITRRRSGSLSDSVALGNRRRERSSSSSEMRACISSSESSRFCAGFLIRYAPPHEL